MKCQSFKFLLIASALFYPSCADKNGADTTQSAANQANAAVTATANSANAVAAESERRVPYVTTPEKVVDEMLKMARIKNTDVLYDLGSGDGRIPITAAKRFGARGVGIDINPQLVKEASENAVKAGVSDKVKFIEGDLFKEDFSAATVVTLYLLPEINLRLRPQLLSQLKPGTRIVSHNYGIGDWMPEQTEVVTTPDGVNHFVFFWRVPERADK